MIHHNKFTSEPKNKRPIGSILTVNINVWKKIRGPFLLPCRIGSHDCAGHWENIDIDCAGCKICGSIHVCHDHNTSITHSNDPHIDRNACEVSAQQDADVCIVTGLCVHTLRYSEHEKSDHPEKGREITTSAGGSTVTSQSHSYMKLKNNNFKSRNKSFKNMNQNNTKQRGVCGREKHSSDLRRRDNEHTTIEGRAVLQYNHILSICQNMLCSQAVTNCFTKERVKLTSRVRSSFMKHIRIFKKNQRNNEPIQALAIIGNIAADLYNYRLFAVEHKQTSHTLQETRGEIAVVCARIITTFINNAHTIIKNFMYNVSPTTFVIGVLYLLRAGLVAQHIIILPEMKILSHILPSENLLYEFFQVKCKCITEVENIIKLQIRMLDVSQLICIENKE
jgi:hypothetical protein